MKVICDNQGKITQNNQRKPKKIEQHTEADSKQQVVLKKQGVFCVRTSSSGRHSWLHIQQVKKTSTTIWL